MNKVVQMLIVLTGVGIISGGLLATVSNWAEPLITANKKAETEAAIFRVQPDGYSYDKINKIDFEAYKVRSQDSEVIGYALVFEGNGFQGKIRLICGLSKDLQKILSLEILEQVETPGLGTKVTESPFIDQFKQLETAPVINWVKGVEPSKPNEIQAITGATISSKAVVNILNKGIENMRKLRESGALQ